MSVRPLTASSHPVPLPALMPVFAATVIFTVLLLAAPALLNDADTYWHLAVGQWIIDASVSFTKGCYIGQETVARLHYKGKPNRHLRLLTSAGELPEGASVSLDGRELGTVGTSVLSPARGPLALAILRREAEPGAEVEVEAPGGGTLTALVEGPPENEG